MALRATDDEASNSPVPGLNYFWQEAEKEPSYEWEQWQQLFKVAVLARHSDRNHQDCGRTKPSCSSADGKPGRKCGCKKDSKLTLHFSWQKWQKNDNG